MLKINQYFCKHDFYLIAKHKIVSENLYKCLKCGVYEVVHTGTMTNFKTKDYPFSEGNWEFTENY